MVFFLCAESVSHKTVSVNLSHDFLYLFYAESLNDVPIIYTYISPIT